MSGVLRADLGEIEAFASRLDTLRSDLDLAGQDLPVTMGPLMLQNRDTLYAVQAGLQEFLQASAIAAKAVDTYLSALATMAHQSVTKIQAQDVALAQSAPHVAGRRAAV
jgi:hypothetical protein